VTGTCQSARGLYLGGAIPVGVSLGTIEGCAEAATVTMRGRCACGHDREKRYCAGHGQVHPPDGVWLCRECADAGHDCPITIIERIDD